MKIIYLIDTLYKAGGMERILTAKANALTERYGCEVLLVTNHQKGRPVFFPYLPESGTSTWMSITGFRCRCTAM